MNERFYKAFHEKNAIQRYVARRVLFNLCQAFGLHVTGDHFYELIPNTKQVAAEYSNRPRPLPGIDWRLTQCEQRVLRLVEQYGAEYFEASRRYGFREKNHYFRGVDALILYLTVRDLKPAKIDRDRPRVLHAYPSLCLGAQCSRDGPRRRDYLDRPLRALSNRACARRPEGAADPTGVANGGLRGTAGKLRLPVRGLQPRLQVRQ